MVLGGTAVTAEAFVSSPGRDYVCRMHPEVLTAPLPDHCWSAPLPATNASVECATAPLWQARWPGR